MKDYRMPLVFKGHLFDNRHNLLPKITGQGIGPTFPKQIDQLLTGEILGPGILKYPRLHQLYQI